MPGPAGSSRDPADANRLSAEGAFLARIDVINYAKEPESDPQGRITFPALIPGASYRIVDRRQPAILGPRVRKEFTVKTRRNPRPGGRAPSCIGKGWPQAGRGPSAVDAAKPERRLPVTYHDFARKSGYDGRGRDSTHAWE